MSDTTKIADATRRAQDNASRAGQSAVDAGARATKETVGQAANLTEHAAERGRQASEAATETAGEATRAATDASLKVGASSRDAMLMGARTAAGVTGRVADIGFDRGQHLLSSSAHAMDIYTGAAERSAERVQALLASSLVLGRGLQKMQHAWMEMVDQSIERAAHRPQDLLRCKTLVEVAEVQRDLYTDAVNHAFETSSRLLELAGRVAHEAVRPLQSQQH